MSLSPFEILTSFDFIGTMIGYTLGLNFYNMINSFMKSIAKPILGKIFHKNLKTLVINIGGMKFFVGDLLGTFIDFALFILVLLLLFNYVLRDFVVEAINKRQAPQKETNDLLREISNNLRY